MNKKDPSGRIGRWTIEIQKHDIEIKYKSGKTNLNADCLSRTPLPETCFEKKTISLIDDGIPTIVEWISAQKTDEYCIKIANELKQIKEGSRQNKKDIDEYQGVLRQRGRIIVPRSLTHRVMNRFHGHPLASHTGFMKTNDQIPNRYFWPNEDKDLTNFIASCLHCGVRKPYGQSKAPLIPREIAEHNWQRVGLDLCGPLVETYRGNRYILVMSDFASRYVELVALPDQKARTVARAFIDWIVFRYGAPAEILSDQGGNFMSNLIKHFCIVLNINQTRTSAYCAHANGLIEKLNRSIADLISSLIEGDWNDWDLVLAQARFLYNTSKHASLNESPHYPHWFFSDPIQPDDFFCAPDRTRIIDRSDDLHLETIRDAMERAKQALIKSQERQKKYYDRNTTVKIYKPGDKVLLKVMKGRSKFQNRYEGPFVVVKRYGKVNYAIKLNNKMSHYVVHANRIKLLPERNSICESKSSDRSLDSRAIDAQHSEGESTESDQRKLIQQPLRPTQNQASRRTTGGAPDVPDRLRNKTVSKNITISSNKLSNRSLDKNTTGKPSDRSKRTRYNLRNKINKPNRLGY